MAHVIKELKFRSREGSSRGASGVNDNITYLVTLDITDAEFTEARYPDPRGIVEIYKVPYGSASPWNAFAKATQYTIVERVTNKTWKVRVDFTVGALPTPTMEARWDRWNVSIRGAAGTEQIIEEPTDVLESWGITEPGGTAIRLGKLIGTPRFDKGEPAESGPSGVTYSATVWYHDAESRIAKKVQVLTKTDSRKVREYTADVRALTYTQTRLFANFNLEHVGRIVEYYKRVNKFKYLGAQPKHLKFVDFVLDEVAHAIGTPDTPGGQRGNSPQLEYGIAYRASVVFLFSAKAFTPLNLVATLTDDLGNQAPIFDSDGNKVVDENWTIAGMDFDTLLNIIQGGTIQGPGPTPI